MLLKTSIGKQHLIKYYNRIRNTCIAHNKNELPKCLHPVFGIKEANEHVCIVSKGKKIVTIAHFQKIYHSFDF